MCGIAGFVGSGTRDQLERMGEAIMHRGPDDSGLTLRGAVGLAHARLSILDLSESGRQPMVLPDGSASIVFNGEIYNFKVLRQDLEDEGVEFKSSSDTEVLLWLYRKYGEGFLEKCAGMFALALFDYDRQKLILARDRMGEKPLYWTKKNSTVYFASELGALMKANVVPRHLDLTALSQYLAFDHVPAPHTILADVQKLLPGTMLVFEDGQISHRRFWGPPTARFEGSEEAALGELDTRLSRSVEGQLLSDVPLGVFLSGGIDSSAVAYYAQRASGRPIDTFTIKFDVPTFDESVYAKEVAQHLGTTHHEEVCTEKDALDLVDSIPDVFSEPVADASVLPTMLLSRFARKSVTVALGGDGGDELFAGYPTFFADALYPTVKKTPEALRAIVRKAVGLFPASHRNFAFTYNLTKLLSNFDDSDARRHAQWLGTFDPAALHRLAGASLLLPPDRELFSHIDAFRKEVDGKNGLLWMYARTYLADQVLVKVDRASMYFALETRAPLLDHRVVEHVFSLPYEYKYRRGKGKYLFKKLMRGKLPDTIIDRKKKGFGVPLASWLTGPLKELCLDLLSPSSVGAHSLFEQSYVDRLIEQHMSRARDHRKELWNLMTFQLWYRRWMR